MRPLILLLCALVSFQSFSQSMTYVEWKEEEKRDSALLPAYGHKKKTDEHNKADLELIDMLLRIDTTNRKASDHLMSIGWDAYYKEDMRTAMYSFNKAWLLDSTNEEAYFGFGGVYGKFDDLDRAMEMYDKGLAINPNNAGILTDVGTIYLEKYFHKRDNKDLIKAEKLFLRALTLQPKRPTAMFKLFRLYLSSENCANARIYYDKCVDSNNEFLTQEYTERLKNECSEMNIE